MKNKISVIFLAVLFCAYQTHAQNDEDQNIYKNDVSINITALLGNALSINDDDTGVPYALSYRRIFNGWGLRISAAGNISNSTVNEFGFRSDLKKSDTELRLGYERIHNLSQRFTITYGLDITGSYLSEKSEVFGQGGSFSQNQIQWLAGGGPAIRFMYHLNKRIIFHTESSMYFTAGQSSTENFNSSIPNRNEDLFFMDLAMPQALFITIAF